jgi:hypothetical protein
MTQLPPLSPELEAVFAPLRAPLPLSPVVVSRVMDRAAAALELTPLGPHRRKHVPLGSRWAFAAVGGAVLMLGAGAYAARAWIQVPASPAPAAAVPGPWQPSRVPRSVAAIGKPAAPAPDPSTRKHNASGRVATATIPAATMNAELQLLRAARQDVMRGDYTAALAVIGQHRRRFENGTLVEEREALRIKSMVGLGRAREAQAAAAAFRTRFPHSVFLSTFERL